MKDFTKSKQNREDVVFMAEIVKDKVLMLLEIDRELDEGTGRYGFFLQISALHK